MTRRDNRPSCLWWFVLGALGWGLGDTDAVTAAEVRPPDTGQEAAFRNLLRGHPPNPRYSNLLLTVGSQGPVARAIGGWAV